MLWPTVDLADILRNPMLRRKRYLLVVALISVAVLAATVELLSGYSDRGPTPEEFRVYGGFLSYLAADAYLPQSDFALARMTLELSDPQYDRSFPPELRTDKTQPSPEFAAFCGFCAGNFVRKNLAKWRLEPHPHGAFGISVVEPPKPEQMSSKQIVWVTRVGFNLWHTRAVLSYSTNCSGDSSCLPRGDAYLLKENGVWNVGRLKENGVWKDPANQPCGALSSEAGELHAHRIVTIRGIYQFGFEISSLLTCAGGRTVELWVENAGSVVGMEKLNELVRPHEHFDNPILNFNYDEQKNTAAWAKLESQPCSEVTLVGQFETKTRLTGGFGHLGAHQHELILVDVLNAKKCEYRTGQHSDFQGIGEKSPLRSSSH